MAEEPKKILVDDDWKAEARREKEKLTQQAAQQPREAMPQASFVELIGILANNAAMGLGGMTQAGKQIPPNLEYAKHFIDMLQVLEDKTKGNLNAEEKKLLD